MCSDMMNLIQSSSIPVAVENQRFRHGRFLLAFFQYLQEGGEVYCLDAGNCFDPYPLAKMARSKGVSPEGVLKNIRVSRAATCHQIVSVVEEMILPLAEQPGGKIVLVLAIDSLFVDEDIPLFERKYLFDRILEGISRASESLGCLITYNRGLEKDRLGRQWHGALAERCRVRRGSPPAFERRVKREQRLSLPESSMSVIPTSGGMKRTGNGVEDLSSDWRNSPRCEDKSSTPYADSSVSFHQSAAPLLRARNDTDGSWNGKDKGDGSGAT